MKIFEMNESIVKYRFGNPIHTGAVVLAEQKEQIPAGMVYFVVSEEEAGIKLKYRMSAEDIVLGLGESLRGINKRGGFFEAYCTDEPFHTPEKKSLYGVHNFLLVDGSESFGLFIDYPGRILYDIGFSRPDELEITVKGCDAAVYIIKGDKLRDIVRSFMTLVGKAYVPPKWAFGYQQCRWSYADAKEVEALAERFIEKDIPCDAIYLDIDYMEDFKDFTVSSERFPDFPSFVGRMKEKGFRLVPIIDAGVKIEKGYDIYEEGIEKGYFCTDKEGKPFAAAVWPGKVHFPDFLNPEARKWFGMKYKSLIDDGIEGFWNDMNEPAVFYTDRGLSEAVLKAKSSENENLNIYSFFALRDAFDNLSNNLEDYGSFYHKLGDRQVKHDTVHNLYGYYMTLAAAEGFKALDPDRRFLLFSRASYIGAHRISGIWTGDNHSWWEHLLLNIKMMASVNMCGFLYSGADTGGFSGDANSSLLIRWVQLSLFTPLFRNHAAMGTRRQEPFAYDEASNGILRNLIRLRYALLPYLYSEYMKAAQAGDVYISPMIFEYGDRMSRRTETQLLVGESVMISPVYEENASGRYVWLPEEMLLWKAYDYENRSYDIIESGHHFIDVALQEVPIFIRRNRMLVFGRHAANVESLDNSVLHIIAFVEDKARYVYYDDDGKTTGYQNGYHWEIIIEIEKSGDEYKIDVQNKGNEQVLMLQFEVVDRSGSVTKKTVVI